MKNIRYSLIIIFAIALSAIGFFSCVKQDFKDPALIIPNAQLTANATIAQIVAIHTINAKNKLDTIVGDTIIQGVVTGNDESGNIYKYMVIQDGSAGIVINVDIGDYSNEYKIGQKVFVKCKGLVLGDYSGLPQLGLPYLDGIIWKVGRIPAVYIKKYIFKDGLPNDTIKPKIITNFSQIMASDINRLVTLDRVAFVDTKKQYTEQYFTTDRALVDTLGVSDKVLVRTSNYASFATDSIPAGVGKITGILSYYQSGSRNRYQLIIRDIKEVGNFSIPPPPPPDAEAFPTISGLPVTSLAEYFNSVITNIDVALPHWTNKVTKGTRLWRGKVFGSDKYVQATTYGSNDPKNTSWLITPAIYYTSGKTLSFKTAIAYYNHTDITGLSVWILYDFNGVSGTWNKINATLAGATSPNYAMIPSGTITLSNYLPANYNGDIYIGFKYMGTNTQTTTFQLDDVVIQ